MPSNSAGPLKCGLTLAQRPNTLIEAGAETPSRHWLTRRVAGIGTASFLADLGHEAPTALLPSLLTVTLGAPAAALRLIEGGADALAGIARFVGGALADDPRPAPDGGGRRLRVDRRALLGDRPRRRPTNSAAVRRPSPCCRRRPGNLATHRPQTRPPC